MRSIVIEDDSRGTFRERERKRENGKGSLEGFIDKVTDRHNYPAW